MSRVHVRIIAALIALAVLSATVLGGYYMYQENMVPERELKKEVKELLKQPGPKVDPGKKVFDQAIDLIRKGEREAAREKLTEIVEVYRDSDRFSDARDVLGEMNMDRLFERAPMPGKLEYTVGQTRQDNLYSIASKFQTTIPYIKRVNNLLGTKLHPGDRLVLYPLNFEVEVRLSDKKLTLVKDGRMFKDYTILGHHLPVPKLNRETTIADIYGWLNEKKIKPDDDRYAWAQKWMQTAGKGTRGGIIFCPEPPKPAEGAQPSPAGIYLSAEDMRELTTIVRPGIPLRFL
jgi:hypothetical protein